MLGIRKWTPGKHVLSVAVAGVLALAGAMGTANAEPRKLRLAYYVPPTHIYATGAIDPFVKALEERSNGELTVDVFPAGQLGAGPDAINMVQNGVVDIAFMTTVYHSQEMPLSQYLVLPHGMDGMVAANVFWRATHEPGPVKDEWDDLGIVLLTAYANPPSEFSSTDVPLDGPESLKGLRIRAPGEVLTLLTEALGAIPMDITSPDQYEALQRDLIKAVNYTFSSWDSYKLSELLHHTTVGLNIYATNPALITSQKMLDSLTPEQRKLLIDTGREFSVIGEQAVLNANTAAFDNFVAGGLKTYQWSEEDMKWLKDKFALVRSHWLEGSLKNGIDGNAVAAQFETLRAAAEAAPAAFPTY